MNPTKTVKSKLVTRPVIVIGSPGESDVTRPRARVELDPSIVQRLAAEVWAGQAPAGDPLMPVTVRRPPLAAAPPLAEAPEPVTVPPADRMFGTTERLVSAPPPGVRSLRFACGVLCAVCIGIAVMATSGWLESRPGPAPVSRPAAVKPTAAGSGKAPVAAATAPHIANSPPAAESKPSAAAAPIPQPEPVAKAPVHASSVSPRAAVDALIAGQREIAIANYRALAATQPSQPAYEAAARILTEMQQRESDGW